jgi:hypothetical protein
VRDVNEKEGFIQVERRVVRVSVVNVRVVMVSWVFGFWWSEGREKAKS